MRVITYVSSVTDQAPERYRCAARIILPDGTLSPMVFHAGDKAAARQAAQTWWDDQIAKERARIELRERQAQRMREAREARSATP